MNTAKQARLHLLSMLLIYYAMSESVQRDDHRSSFHDIVHFRYDEHRPALHAEGLRTASSNKLNTLSHSFFTLNFKDVCI
jgi:hypothetical protein